MVGSVVISPIRTEAVAGSPATKSSSAVDFEPPFAAEPELKAWPPLKLTRPFEAFPYPT